jgi:hypothetical protein
MVPHERDDDLDPQDSFEDVPLRRMSRHRGRDAGALPTSSRAPTEGSVAGRHGPLSTILCAGSAFWCFSCCMSSAF